MDSINNSYNNNPYQSNLNQTQYQFVSIANENELVSLDFLNNKTLIGYTAVYVKSLEALCLKHKGKKEEYKNLLIDNGIIKKKLSPEEKMDKMAEMIEKQNIEIEALKKNNNTGVNNHVNSNDNGATRQQQQDSGGNESNHARSTELITTGNTGATESPREKWVNEFPSN